MGQMKDGLKRRNNLSSEAVVANTTLATGGHFRLLQQTTARLVLHGMFQQNTMSIPILEGHLLSGKPCSYFVNFIVQHSGELDLLDRLKRDSKIADV